MLTKSRRNCLEAGNGLSSTDWRAMTPKDRATLKKVFSWPQSTAALARRYDVTERTIRKWMKRLGYAAGFRLTEAEAKRKRWEKVCIPPKFYLAVA